MSKTTLFLLPYAGGGSRSYHCFEKYSTHTDLVLHSLTLPGRESRFDESPLSCLEDMVEDLFLQMAKVLPSTYALYGHSMGALLSYLLARKIYDEKWPPPQHLFVSGRQAPSVPHHNSTLHRLPGNEFRKQLMHYGGLPSSVIGNPKLLALFEPYIRADFKAVETYHHSESVPLDLPISVFLGRSDVVSFTDGMLWDIETNATFDIQYMPGKHFFIFHNTEALINFFSLKFQLSGYESQAIKNPQTNISPV
ncbi:thioesterase [Fulvivirga sp. M361]|uniref:thioesterase II family protein n=1 Tax=Fulvivirga sp. M361 TaxID=2594266 RepID=UPI00117A2BF4|nr:thioesterase domain-containing protein [Fulvivirga sp. M361]TRX60221.1 thioesterase [Fulvivirga sp. M361]